MSWIYSSVGCSFSQHAPAKREQPAYKVSLSEEELSALGFFTAAWSQVDHIAQELISSITKTDPFYGEILLGNVTSGAMFSLLQKLALTVEHEGFQKAAKLFTNHALNLVKTRNHIAHGIWGFYLDDWNQFPGKAAVYKKAEAKPIMATDLVDIGKKASRLSIEGLKLSILLGEVGHGFKRPVPEFLTDPTKEHPTFSFGKGPPPGL